MTKLLASVCIRCLRRAFVWLRPTVAGHNGYLNVLRHPSWSNKAVQSWLCLCDKTLWQPSLELEACFLSLLSMLGELIDWVYHRTTRFLCLESSGSLWMFLSVIEMIFHLITTRSRILNKIPKIHIYVAPKCFSIMMFLSSLCFTFSSPIHTNMTFLKPRDFLASHPPKLCKIQNWKNRLTGMWI